MSYNETNEMEMNLCVKKNLNELIWKVRRTSTKGQHFATILEEFCFLDGPQTSWLPSRKWGQGVDYSLCIHTHKNMNLTID
jgi:hypothetical protein